MELGAKVHQAFQNVPTGTSNPKGVVHRDHKEDPQFLQVILKPHFQSGLPH